jgi:hypothetical protein
MLYSPAISECIGGFVKRLLSILLFSFSLTPFASATELIDASARGFVCNSTSTSTCVSNNNGAAATNNYFAGFQSGKVGGQFRDWFEFDIPTLTGSLLSATLNLDEPAAVGHQGGSLTYAIYGLGAQPLVFTDVTTSNPFALPVTTSSTSDGTTISITLNSAALAAITADQGGHIFIGGIASGESSSTLAGDFAVSAGSGNVTSLSLTTGPAPVPEPASIVLFAPLLIGSLVAFRRKTRRAG